MARDSVLKRKCDEGEKTDDESGKSYGDLLYRLETYLN